METDRKCVVGYKTAISDGMVYGQRFHYLEECCHSFRMKFMYCGNSKSPNFNFINSDYSQAGLNFGTYHGELNVFTMDEPIHFCPFCGAKIEIKEVKKVLIEREIKQVPGDLVEEEIM